MSASSRGGYASQGGGQNVVDLLSSEVLSPEYIVEKAATAKPRSPTPRRTKKPKFISVLSSDGINESPLRRRFVEAPAISALSAMPAPTSASVPASRSKSAPKSAPKAAPKTKPIKLAKVSWNRNDSVKEMLCAIHGNLDPLGEALKEASVRTTQRAPTELAGVPGYISLRRETKTVWNHAMQTYIEGQIHTEREKKVIVVLDAAASPAFGQNPVPFFQQVEKALGGEIIFIAEGFDKLFQKQMNAYNRALQRRTRAAVTNTTGGGAEEPLPAYPSREDHIRVKIDLQRTGRRLVYTNDRKATVRWIVDLIKDISIKRYQSDEILKISAKSVKSKTEVREIVAEALSQVPGVSRRQAQTLSLEYATLGHIFAQHTEGTDLQRLLHSMDPEECL